MKPGFPPQHPALVLPEQDRAACRGCGYVEALLGQRLPGDNARQRRRGIGFAGQQHLVIARFFMCRTKPSPALAATTISTPSSG